MMGNTLIWVYGRLFEMGVARSRQDFSARYLGRGVTYFRDFQHRDRRWVRVPSNTVVVLRARLTALARVLPRDAAQEVLEVVARIDRCGRIADELGYTRIGR